jgi:hypothetical protein
MISVPYVVFLTCEPFAKLATTVCKVPVRYRKLYPNHRFAEHIASFAKGSYMD